MKVILLADIPKVGNKYDVKDFAQGYAQNVLLSKGLAELATPQALAKIEAHKALVRKRKEQEVEDFNSLLSTIQKNPIKIFVNANEKGHLFKAINYKDIAKAIKEALNIEIDESIIITDNIKELGAHTVILKREDIEGKFQVIIEKA